MPDGTGIRDEVNFRDMQVVADLETLRIVPWERETAICLADCRLDGEPLEADPRNILRRAIAAAEAQGLHISVGHELEFFLLRRTPEGRLLPYQPTPGARLPDGRPHRPGRRHPADGGQCARAWPPVPLRQPRVRPVAVGDQHALRGRAHGRRRGPPAEARDQRDRRAERARRHLHRQAHGGRRDVRLPPPHLGVGRGHERLRRPEGRASGSPIPPAGSWAASSRARAG